MACRKMNEDVAYARNTESGCKISAMLANIWVDATSFAWRVVLADVLGRSHPSFGALFFLGGFSRTSLLGVPVAAFPLSPFFEGFTVWPASLIWEEEGSLVPLDSGFWVKRAEFPAAHVCAETAVSFSLQSLAFQSVNTSFETVLEALEVFRPCPSSGLSESMLQWANEGILRRIFMDKQSGKLHCLARSVALFGACACYLVGSLSMVVRWNFGSFRTWIFCFNFYNWLFEL